MEIDPTTIDWAFVLLGTLLMYIMFWVFGKSQFEDGRRYEREQNG